MSGRTKDWMAISKHPKFVELKTKKTAFLVKLWLFGSLSYFLLPIGAAYAPAIFKTKVIGRLNFAYFFCLYQFIMGWAIAVYYAHKCNRDFDPLTKEVLDDIETGAIR